MHENDIDAVRRVFAQLTEEPLANVQQLLPAMTVVDLAPGQYLFHANTPQPYLFCVASGLLKLFYETLAGDEWIKAFIQEEMLFASVRALDAGGSASFSALALESSRLVRIDYAALERLAATDIRWQKLLAQGFKLYGARKEQRERELLLMTAEQRYQNFLHAHPSLDQRVRQKDIAAYIRITPVALSRIKKRLG